MKKVIDFLKENLDKNASIVVACSGGPDSMCLLDLVTKLKDELNLNIIVAHVNHKLRSESEEEAKATFDEIIANAKKAHPDIVPDGVEVQKMMETGQEVIVGMIKDKQFGPMIAFGMGGIYVNLIEDVSFKLANGISSQEIDEQINDTKVSELLKGYRGEAPCDIDAVKEAIKRVARLTLDFPEISELDINPIFVYENGSSALDIKIKL